MWDIQRGLIPKMGARTRRKTMSENVKIFNAALDESEGKELILRGSVDPQSLRLIKSGPYQREVLPLGTINKIAAAFRNGGSVPDIDLGVRGGDFDDKGDVVILKGDVYVIDGLQRMTAALSVLQEGKIPRLGATVHFNTTETSERDRFRILNAERTKLSPNVLLRNLKETMPVIDTMYNMTMFEKGFPLHQRITWDQRMKRQDLIPALTFLKVVGVMHSHVSAGKFTSLDELARAVQVQMDKVGRNIFRDNIKEFYELVDRCWGIRKVVYKDPAIWLRGAFLSVLAQIFSDHSVFWRENRFFVEKDLERKIQTFSIHDPSVISLASANGKASDLLYAMFVDHINSGKRTRRLVPRNLA